MFSPKSIEHDGEQGVINRRYPLCSPPANGIQLGDLLTQCPYSLRFSAVCCLNRRNSGVWGSTCRKIILVFTDGACLNNGKDYATAGMGIAIGRGGEDVDQWAIPIDDSIDPRAPRTNQRAELLAAMKGLEKICEVDQGWLAVQHDDRLRRIGRVEEPCNPVCVIVVTDSEYVVKNMNENLPTWKVRPISKGYLR
ncbi:hypothetical protein BV22DRAFT_1037006 [Leucogyrophana mollusca]|uniref:Uncharacterized protein n=1 Tax=Leucogyrophana mollusca TaxID=85980 RepID=A0ACB8BAP9_9AGAM|nr:hypothetical protein BV22DRAFT_1037006 [Leucogyrophana mollusca]